MKQTITDGGVVNLPGGKQKLIGEDKFTREDYEALGHVKLSRAKLIRGACKFCRGEKVGLIRTCPAVACPLWPYRMGDSPFTERRGHAEPEKILAKARAVKASKAKVSKAGKEREAKASKKAA